MGTDRDCSSGGNALSPTRAMRETRVNTSERLFLDAVALQHDQLNLLCVLHLTSGNHEKAG